ncbi:amidase (plasmid) [Rhizobium sp. 32-5/1]|uniref:amidase n=1 Tax=Rhizobium sp. 32-5/1 TaxID=3019602 RepID=UPI00240D3B4B|nr:amidase [Rhizobium sp. 32-5/1]WEZ85762.1 amidase [Rhizobium sp. 32-5/1]
MTNITSLSATELSAAIHARRYTCVSVMGAFLARIATINPVINAIVSLRDADALLAEATAADRELDQGHSRGFLHGMPFAIKDLSEARGIRCTYGSPLYRDFVPDFDDIHVERIRAAGAIIIGKTNAPEKGLGSHSYNPVFGVTCNPYDPTKSAGGSSGGAAAGLAARILPLADGSDMMGSLRNPAAFNNVIGMRPSFGRIPALDNELYLGHLAVNGPMGRSVADVAALLDIQSGYDPRDPASLPKEDFAGVRPKDARGLRLGWLGDFGGYLPFEPGVLHLCETALERFRSVGATVETVDNTFDMARLWQAWKTYRHFLVANGNAADYADPNRRALLKPELIWEIESGQGLSASEVHAASLIRSDWYRHMLTLFVRYDFLILPSAQVFPFDVDLHWPSEIAGRRMDTYHRWMEVVIGPTMAGLPVAAMPTGFGAAGLPTGIQIIGRPRADRAVLELAMAYEYLCGAWVFPEAFH